MFFGTKWTVRCLDDSIGHRHLTEWAIKSDKSRCRIYQALNRSQNAESPRFKPPRSGCRTVQVRAKKSVESGPESSGFRNVWWVPAKRRVFQTCALYFYNRIVISAARYSSSDAATKKRWKNELWCVIVGEKTVHENGNGPCYIFDKVLRCSFMKVRRNVLVFRAAMLKFKFPRKVPLDAGHRLLLFSSYAADALRLAIVRIIVVTVSDDDDSDDHSQPACVRRASGREESEAADIAKIIDRCTRFLIRRPSHWKASEATDIVDMQIETYLHRRALGRERREAADVAEVDRNRTEQFGNHRSTSHQLIYRWSSTQTIGLQIDLFWI